MGLGAQLGHGPPDASGHKRAATDSRVRRLTWPKPL
jgi:hypothetical protein